MKLYLHLMTGTWYNWSEGDEAFDQTMELKQVKTAVKVLVPENKDTYRRDVEVLQDLIQVGSASEYDHVIIEQKGIASKHCLIYTEHGKWYVKPLNDHAVFVGNEQVLKIRELENGDELSFRTNTVLDVILR